MNSKSRESEKAGLPDRPVRPRKTVRHFLQALKLACVHIWHVSPTISIIFLVLVTLQGIGPLATVWAGKLLLDSILEAISTQGSPAALRGVIVVLVLQLAILVTNTVVTHLSQFLSSLMGKRLTLRMEHAVLKKASELDMSYFDNAAFYNMITRAQREAKAKPLALLVGITSICRNAVTFVSMAVVVSLIGIPYLLAMIALSVPILFIEIRYGEKYYWLRLYQTHEARMANYLSGIMTKRECISEILSYGTWPYLLDKWFGVSRQLMHEDIGLQKRRALAGVSAEVFSVVGGLVATGFIVLCGIRNMLSAGTIIMQSRAFSGGMLAFKDMLNGVSHLFEQAIFLHDFVQFEQLHTAMRNDGRRRVGRSVDSIEFRDVSFRYPGSAREVLRNINLTIGRGQSVLVVGANGAGKTTLIKLLTRLYDPTKGRILLNGIDYREYDIDSLRQAIGVIFQEYGRYAFTIAENIALSDRNGGEDLPRIVAAAQRANADSFVAKLPRGYETMASRVFDGGVELSLGQWQRVCLGRLFMKESPIMVLDEPTASLDVETEAHLLKEIVETFQDRIRILVSHRTFRSGLADQVIVMKEGEIIEVGTHEDLMETASEYARLWQLYHSLEVCS